MEHPHDRAGDHDHVRPERADRADLGSSGFSSEQGATFECQRRSRPVRRLHRLHLAQDLLLPGERRLRLLRTGAEHRRHDRLRTPATRSFSVDATPPVATITSFPPSPTNAAFEAFGFLLERAQLDVQVQHGQHRSCGLHTLHLARGLQPGRWAAGRAAHLRCLRHRCGRKPAVLRQPFGRDRHCSAGHHLCLPPGRRRTASLGHRRYRRGGWLASGRLDPFATCTSPHTTAPRHEQPAHLRGPRCGCCRQRRSLAR